MSEARPSPTATLMTHQRHRRNAFDALQKPLLRNMIHQFADGSKQGRALSLPKSEPWPELINGADLLGLLSASIRRYS